MLKTNFFPWITSLENECQTLGIVNPNKPSSYCAQIFSNYQKACLSSLGLTASTSKSGPLDTRSSQTFSLVIKLAVLSPTEQCFNSSSSCESFKTCEVK